VPEKNVSSLVGGSGSFGSIGAPLVLPKAVPPRRATVKPPTTERLPIIIAFFPVWSRQALTFDLVKRKGDRFSSPKSMRSAVVLPVSTRTARDEKRAKLLRQCRTALTG
jgi:hypothetical protein